jgi:hypothetical protein
LKILLILLIIFTITISIFNYNDIIKTYSDVWTFQPNFTSIILHFTYIIIIISIVYGS